MSDYNCIIVLQLLFFCYFYFLFLDIPTNQCAAIIVKIDEVCYW